MYVLSLHRQEKVHLHPALDTGIVIEIITILYVLLKTILYFSIKSTKFAKFVIFILYSCRYVFIVFGIILGSDFSSSVSKLSMYRCRIDKEENNKLN